MYIVQFVILSLVHIEVLESCLAGILLQTGKIQFGTQNTNKILKSSIFSKGYLESHCQIKTVSLALSHIVEKV